MTGYQPNDGRGSRSFSYLYLSGEFNAVYGSGTESPEKPVVEKLRCSPLRGSAKLIPTELSNIGSAKSSSSSGWSLG
ncbi:hypothetical protein SAMN05444817_1082 [Corynebacterium appendicis CIP 107643]|uniref:Uncharacterized protein n=1 Tax=Corynebacterium appendicis CIP 107643 TaxID=1161099 RepID=A0A1N7JHH8_9CORY|nr:hypothetical protein SAMN05444817_1082 [Corynebacterium appendicis CIP 107643]